MRTNKLIWGGALLLAAQIGTAGLPLPGVTYYGQIRDEYGSAYTENVEIFAMRGTNLCYQYEVTGWRALGVNYQLEIDMDNGGTRYAPYAVQAGEEIELVVVALGRQMPLAPVSRLTVPAAGSTVALDLVAGADSDGDGLPDAWEQMLIDQSGGALTALEDVAPNDDFDADGMSNINEFFSGTFPFLAFDRLAIDTLDRTASGRLTFRFLTVAGMYYSIESTPDITAETWEQLPFTLTPDGMVETGYLVGNGDYKTLYIEAEKTQQYIKLRSH